MNPSLCDAKAHSVHGGVRVISSQDVQLLLPVLPGRDSASSFLLLPGCQPQHRDSAAYADLGLNLFLPRTNDVTLGKSFSLSVTQFPPLYNGDDSGPFLGGLLEGSIESILTKSSERYLAQKVFIEIFVNR